MLIVPAYPVSWVIKCIVGCAHIAGIVSLLLHFRHELGNAIGPGASGRDWVIFRHNLGDCPKTFIQILGSQAFGNRFYSLLKRIKTQTALAVYSPTPAVI